jgi:hypothetical protein
MSTWGRRSEGAGGEKGRGRIAYLCIELWRKLECFEEL